MTSQVWLSPSILSLCLRHSRLDCPQSANAAGVYSPGALVSLLSPSTDVSDWTASGWFIPVTNSEDPHCSTALLRGQGGQQLSTILQLLLSHVAHADGSLSPLNQRHQYMPEVAVQPRKSSPLWYTGPTQCPHRAAGGPCYGTFPDIINMPGMLTPKRAINAKDRGDKKDEDKDEPKTKKDQKDPTQRTLEQSFGVGAASSSLQLTN